MERGLGSVRRTVYATQSPSGLTTGLPPEARRKAVPGVKLCIDCMQERDNAYRVRGGINRRGSKDSQLR